MKETVKLTVDFQLNAEEADMLQLKSQLEERESIKEVIYSTQEENARLTQEDVGEDFIATLGFNPIPASLDIHFVSSAATQTSMAALKRELSSNTLVRQAYYQSNILTKIEENAQKILIVIIGLSVVFSIIAITLINGTIRLDLYSKRFLIRSMQLVGATRWFIMRPFIWKSLLNAIWSIVLSFLVLAAVVYYLYREVPDLGEIIRAQDLILAGAIVFASGLLLTGICSLFATRRYLRMKLEELY